MNAPVSPLPAPKTQARKGRAVFSTSLPHAHTEPAPGSTPQNTGSLHLCSMKHPFQDEVINLFNKYLLKTFSVPITVLVTKEAIIMSSKMQAMEEGGSLKLDRRNVPPPTRNSQGQVPTWTSLIMLKSLAGAAAAHSP